MAEIHPTAIIHPSAAIADDATIGPYSIVEPEVVVGPGCRIGAHVTLGERLVLGARVRVYNYACLGTASQDLKHRGERSHAEIGDDSIVREFVTLNRATREGGVTRVGRGVVLMNYAHVAHECQIADGAILVNGATLGGEVEIGSRVNIGGLVGVHQFCRIGACAMIGANSKVTRDILPYMLADGHPARPYGPNQVGLERNGFSRDQIGRIRAIFRILFCRGGLLRDNCTELGRLWPDCPFTAEVMAFIATSRRGIALPRPGLTLPEEPDLIQPPAAER